MSSEQIVNTVMTNLAVAITATDTLMVVASPTGFPTTGNFRIRIDSELLLVMSVVGATFVVTRGIEGTTAAAHRAGVTVRGGLLTAGALNAFAGAQASIVRSLQPDPYDYVRSSGVRAFLGANFN